MQPVLKALLTKEEDRSISRTSPCGQGSEQVDVIEILADLRESAGHPPLLQHRMSILLREQTASLDECRQKLKVGGHGLSHENKKIIAPFLAT